MKYALVALALAAAVQAQTRDDIPECALPCLDDAIASESNCATTDYTCVCANFSAIRGAAAGCIIEECGSDVALNEVLPASERLCENQGGGDESSAAETTPAETTPAETTPAEETSSSAAAGTTTVAVTTTVNTAVNTVTTAPSAPTETGAEEPATSEVVTAGAAAMGKIGAVGMFILGALAL